MAVGGCEGSEIGGVGQVGADDWCRGRGERSDEYAVGVVVERPGDYWVCRNTGGGGFRLAECGVVATVQVLGNCFVAAGGVVADYLYL